MKSHCRSSAGPILLVVSISALLFLRFVGPSSDVARYQSEFDTWYSSCYNYGERLAHRSIDDKISNLESQWRIGRRDYATVEAAYSTYYRGMAEIVTSWDFDTRFSYLVALDARLADLEPFKSINKQHRLQLHGAALAVALGCALLAASVGRREPAVLPWAYVILGVVAGYLIALR